MPIICAVDLLIQRNSMCCTKQSSGDKQQQNHKTVYAQIYKGIFIQRQYLSLLKYLYHALSFY